MNGKAGGLEMTINELIAERLDETGQSKTAAAKALGITRMTLDSWLGGLYVPEPDAERVRTIAEWAGASEALVLAMILTARGIDPTVIEELALIDPAKNRVSELTRVMGQTTHWAELRAA